MIKGETMKRSRNLPAMFARLALTSVCLAVVLMMSAIAKADSTVTAQGAHPWSLQPYRTAQGGSGQGGYLGQNPGAGMPAVEVQPTREPSRQGGYLGLGVGANVVPLVKPTAADYLTSPTAWCTAESSRPNACRAKAAIEHDYCKTRPDHYGACRRALDSMHN